MPIDRERLIEAAKKTLDNTTVICADGINDPTNIDWDATTSLEAVSVIDAILPILAADEQAVRDAEQYKVLSRIEKLGAGDESVTEVVQEYRHYYWPDWRDYDPGAATTPAGQEAQ